MGYWNQNAKKDKNIHEKKQKGGSGTQIKKDTDYYELKEAQFKKREYPGYKYALHSSKKYNSEYKPRKNDFFDEYEAIQYLEKELNQCKREIQDLKYTLAGVQSELKDFKRKR